jgi:flagellar biosynthesis anti-sigma factor FlgM
MSNTIPPLQQTLPAEPMSGQSASTAPAKAGADAASAAPQTEAVTLSEAAQTSTQLLSAARQSGGVDQSAVGQIRSALAAGNYNVSPEDLAQAIATVLKETNA